MSDLCQYLLILVLNKLLNFKTHIKPKGGFFNERIC